MCPRLSPQVCRGQAGSGDIPKQNSDTEEQDRLSAKPDEPRNVHDLPGHAADDQEDGEGGCRGHHSRQHAEPHRNYTQRQVVLHDQALKNCARRSIVRRNLGPRSAGRFCRGLQRLELAGQLLVQ